MAADAGYSVELDRTTDRTQQEERLTVRWDDGREEKMRLHEYGRVYAVPGLYEEVVQRQLECESPDKLADALLAEAGDPASLRVFDVGAGNGVVGEALRSRGVGAPVIGLDAEPEAGPAAARDRPDLYERYLTGGLEEFSIPDLVAEHDLNAFVAAGALGFGHITPEVLDGAWTAFPSGSWLAVTVPEELLDAEDDPMARYFAELRQGEHDTEVTHVERFQHRLRMSGEPIFYDVIVARRT
jgi:trans-aconitate methyltransferase